MTITLDDIRAQLQIRSPYHGDTGEFALPMVDAMEARAKVDFDYCRALALWLSEGGTVLLRDDLCEGLKNADFVQAEQGSLLDGKRPYAFNDMWMSVDTAWLNCAVRAGIRPPYTEDIPKEPGYANLFHDPFRQLAPWKAIYRIHGRMTQNRYQTKEIAVAELTFAGYSIEEQS